MRVILSGSRAIKYHFPDFYREPKDWDFLIDSFGVKSKIKGCEYKHIPFIFDFVKGEVLTPDELLTLKASHIFWDINREKHLEDIRFLASKNAKIIVPLFYKLYEFWTKKHGVNRRSKLDMNKEEFFDNKINYVLDHDHLHTLINPSPTYLKVLKDGEEVNVSEEKFHNLTKEEKADLVREEVYVMAWERGRKTKNYVKSYKWMFDKFLFHHAPLWEAIFIIENINELSIPEYDYFEKIENQLDYDGERV